MKHFQKLFLNYEDGRYYQKRKVALLEDFLIMSNFLLVDI